MSGLRTGATFPANAGTFRRDAVGNSRAGCCTLCRSSKVSAAKPCVELGPNSQPFREGMVVLCFNCAVSVGQSVGMLSQKDAEGLRAGVAEAGLEVDRLRSELEAFAALRDALDSVKEGASA